MHRKNKIGLVSILLFAIIMMIGLQVFFVRDFIKQERNDYNTKANTLVELIAIRHEKLEERRKYDILLNESFEDKYYDILKDEAKLHFQIKEQIEIHDTTVWVEDHNEDYVIITGYAIDSVTGMSVQHKVLAKKYKKIQEILSEQSEQHNFGKGIDIMRSQINETKDLLHKSKYINDLIVQAFREDLFMKSTERIDYNLLLAVIQEEVKHHDMSNNFLFRVVDSKKQIQEPKFFIDHYSEELSGHFFETNLFPADLFHESIQLQIHFPDKNFFILKRMMWLIIITIMIVAAVIFAILMLTRTLLHQQNYNTMKSDFISNMTHEFKTPISTISLACEALTDSDMSDDAQVDNPFIQMIQQENKRLESLVESILQSAVIEKGELKVKNEKLDFHDLLLGVVKNVQLRIQSTSGDLYTDLAAKNYWVHGDHMHLTNVLNNLIDNAIKYCEKAPIIYINTYNESGNGLVFEVKDNGIGIKREYLPRIFDKLYRVPTGNVHNVKGFGLGLSYVKSVIDLHNGKIEVDSKINEGSTFRIKLNVYE